MAGGLHKKVDSHARPIAHMALKMMELSEEVLTPDGKPIKVSFHSSPCCAVSEAVMNIAGKRLFGCTTAQSSLFSLKLLCDH